MNRYLLFFSEEYPLVIRANSLAEVAYHHPDAVAIILLPNEEW